MALRATSTEVGGTPWKAVGEAVLRSDGAVTVGNSQSASLWVPLPLQARQEAFRVQVKCQPTSADWVGLSLGGELGDFFKSARISVLLRPSGNYLLVVSNGAEQWTAPLKQGTAPKFDAKGWNTLTVEFDPAKRTLSALINGVDVVRDQPLGDAFPVAQVQFAGVRFNEPAPGRPPMQPNAPAIDDFSLGLLNTAQNGGVPAAKTQPVAQTSGAEKAEAAPKATLEPVNRTQFFVKPNETQLLEWQTTSGDGTFTCEVRDYRNRLISSRPLTVQNGRVQLPLRVPAGFYELKFSSGGQRFGVVSLAPHEGRTDPFFAIDAALSWLETRPEVRTDLVALLKRSGIGTVRERLSWGAVNPQPQTWDWETNRNFDTLRREYVRQGVKVLELFHGAPEWAKIEASNPYPQRLQGTKDSWQAIAKHWQGAWNSLEVWNEPDIGSGGELPADQYLPVVKTINYALSESGAMAQVGGGVFGYFNPNFIRSSVRNGLLDQVDFVSFHTYAKAPALEQIVDDYRRSLAVPGQAPVALWLTESGQPWKSGQERPQLDEDSVSALDIAMKAIESKACGIARYFGFVYPYYVEGPRNFGMMGQDVSPLRSMAAYVQTVAALSNASYIGDLNVKMANVQRARVFTRGTEAIVVLYTENPSANASVPWNGPVSRVQGIDGRPLTRLKNGAIPLSDGLAYVSLPLNSLAGKVARQTRATRLTALARSARSGRATVSPLVLQPLLPTEAQPSKRGYQLAGSATSAFPMRVRISNLSNATKQVLLRGTLTGGAKLPEQKIEVAAGSSQEAKWDIDFARLVQQANAESLQVSISGQEVGGAQLSPISLELFGEGDLATYLKLYPASVQLPINDLTRWAPKISPTGKMEMQTGNGGSWVMKSSFKAGDSWVFPEFRVNTDLTGSEGFVARIRCMAPGIVRLMVKERSGATYFTPFSVVPADGKWHDIALHWPDLAALPSAPPDANGQLDLNQVESIAIGMNSKSDENTLEVASFYVARKPRASTPNAASRP